MYGKLVVFKSTGPKTIFAISNKDGSSKHALPDLDDWLMKRIGKDVSLTYTDAYFQIADLEETMK